MSSQSDASVSSSSPSASANGGEKKKIIPKRFLGKTGMLVSELCLGAATLQWNSVNTRFLPACTQEVSLQILNDYVHVGGNFIDTADAYADSEVCLGNWLASKSSTTGFRDSLVLATKVRSPAGPDDNDVGLSRKHIMAAVERSLQRMQTSYIDLYQVHAEDARTDIYDIVRTLNDLVRSGKVRNVGFSNFTPSQAQKAMDYSHYMGLEPFVADQAQYSLMCRYPEWELIPQCVENNMAFLPYSPLMFGWLSGKYRRSTVEAAKDSRLAWADGAWPFMGFAANAQERTWALIDELDAIAQQLKASVAQVAIRWVAQRPGVTSVIIGARTVEQLHDNLGAAWIKLSEEQMQRLNKVSETPPPYPYNVIKGMSR